MTRIFYHTLQILYSKNHCICQTIALLLLCWILLQKDELQSHHTWRRYFNAFTETISLAKRLLSKIQGCFGVSPYTNTNTRLYCCRHIQWKYWAISRNSNHPTAKCCLEIRPGKTRKRINSLANKKCFDKECRLKRCELRKLANKKHQDPLNAIIREKYHNTLALYKKLLNSKNNDYCNAKISELEKTADNSAANTFWQCLKSMDDTRKGEDVPSISEENWSQYFHNLHSNEPLNPTQQNICNELKWMPWSTLSSFRFHDNWKRNT